MFLHLLSGSIILPCLIGKPKCFHTTLDKCSKGKKNFKSSFDNVSVASTHACDAIIWDCSMPHINIAMSYLVVTLGPVRVIRAGVVVMMCVEEV